MDVTIVTKVTKIHLQVHADEADHVSVVEGIPVASDDIAIADDRIDEGFEDDQIAEESQLTEVFAQERDGGGHGHGHGHHHAEHAAPAPAAASYDSPQAPPAPAPVASSGQQYGAPQAAPIDEYGAPQAPISTQYNPPAQPQKPIPVPLPIGVKPGSIVIPGRPQSYKPPPPPQVFLIDLNFTYKGADNGRQHSQYFHSLCVIVLPCPHLFQQKV